MRRRRRLNQSFHCSAYIDSSRRPRRTGSETDSVTITEPDLAPSGRSWFCRDASPPRSVASFRMRYKTHLCRRKQQRLPQEVLTPALRPGTRRRPPSAAPVGGPCLTSPAAEMSSVANRWADICRSVPQTARRKRLAPSPSESGQSESSVQRRTRRFNQGELESDLRRSRAETGSWFYNLTSASCERKLFWWRSGETRREPQRKERNTNKHTSCFNSTLGIIEKDETVQPNVFS